MQASKISVGAHTVCLQWRPLPPKQMRKRMSEPVLAHYSRSSTERSKICVGTKPWDDPYRSVRVELPSIVASTVGKEGWLIAGRVGPVRSNLVSKLTAGGFIKVG